MLNPPQNSTQIEQLPRRLQTVRAQIAAAAHDAGRIEESVTLVAVSKGHPPATVAAAARLGVAHFGENYLQEALPKIAALPQLPATWHFIGRLQANKTRLVAEHFSWVHGIDRLQIARRLSAQRAHYAPTLNVCIQVNVAGDARKAGIESSEALALAAEVSQLPRLALRGFMCMLPEQLDPQTQADTFAGLQELLQAAGRQGLVLDTLSMGMSADFEVAIAQGATMVRIGTAIFGPRSLSAE
jgi:pyridoxal phosphate enzyme (YggS family)